ncbi:GntR family transcriptional regulator [Pelagimonas varians]|uniref:HTH-type transcriptional regulator McbR n=1 Tax=Pelagimonas varians TaxID=696760 RepID=A0A238L4F6_9RHOB|nr:GntR family transcriptional regulator [Pelagimonas varians]PYG25605.1 GntR family transcriptional regulator [Pelagimonas varians]SMX49877.1 HTH-type transcriptional regulator McbR [Pelagimonas varians]
MNEIRVKLTEPGSLVDRLVVVIRETILAGGYEPGAHIGVKKIADMHGVSMIPVREALARLLASRLVRVEPNRGYFVADKPTREEFAQFVQFRELFEVSTVDLGFDNTTEADIEALRRLNDKMRKIVKHGQAAKVEWGRLNGEFHLILIGLARNDFITEQYRNLSFDHMHFQLARAYDIEFTSLTLLVEQHDRMIDALVSRNKPLLLACLSEHINNLRLPT